MWAAFIFTLVFISLGIGVLFVAMSGGPGGARRRMASQSRGTRRLALVNFVIGLLVLGLGEEIYRCDILDIPNCD